MTKAILMAAVAAGVTVTAFGWDVEHDEVAQLTGESLPAEIKAQFDFDDFGVLMANCHFPDGTEWEPRRFRDLDDLEAIVGPEDRALVAARGFYGYWMHTADGKATFMSLLARAFGRGDHRRAAFYLSALTHQIGDESALNHPTLLNFIQYCHYAGVSFGTKKVEDGAKNVFGFRSDGLVVRMARERLRGYRPLAATGGDFREQQLSACVAAVNQAAYAAEKEVAIAFGRPGAADALADLVAMQVKAILDVVWTCWTNRSPEAPLPFDDFVARFERGAAAAARTLDPARQAVFADLFDKARNPLDPKGTVVLLCEALGLRSDGVQSYVDRLVTGACGRTLRDAGYAVEAYDFGALRPGCLDVKRTPILVVAAGHQAPTDEQARALVDYRNGGGRIVYICGRNPTNVKDRRPGDPKDIAGFAGLLVDRKPEELPVSPGWARAGACPDWRKLAVEVAGVRYPLKRDANGDGWAKPVCTCEILVGAGVEPLAYVDNGVARFCVAARKGNVTWLPVYLLSPFLFANETTLDFGALKLDSFARKVFLLAIGQKGLEPVR